MKVSGFSFIKNALKFDYPIEEAIRSVLPLCDDFILAVGDSDDDTLEFVKQIAPDKIQILKTVWNEDLLAGGHVLADETNKAIKAIGEDSDWCFYIQGDEVLHEHYLDVVYEGMKRWNNNKRVDGLLFNYKHFYGSYDYVGATSYWYRKEIRVIRNNRGIYSYKDAQGFRKGDNQKLLVKPIDASIYHYGWVKEPEKMLSKRKNDYRYWYDQEQLEKEAQKIARSSEFDYSKIDVLERFEGTHPKVMLDRIKQKNWSFDYDISRNKLSLKERVKRLYDRVFGHQLGEYRNYKEI